MQTTASHIAGTGLEFLVDAHVHIHDGFDIARQLDTAASNFASQAEKLAATADAEFVLCLTECYGTNRFNDFMLACDQNGVVPGLGGSEWQIRRSGDPVSVYAEHPRSGRILIVAGRQIVTAEKLEVLGVGTAGDWRDGRPIRETIDALLRSNAVPVLPWGFGKWLGRRGRIVRNLIDEYRRSSLYLGDNSGRLGIAPEPGEFCLAGQAGIAVLPGSDTLPFSSEVSKTASFGFYARDVPDLGGAWESLRSVLVSGRVHVRPFGTLESPLRFVRNQVAMQYLTRVASRQRAN